MLDELIAVTVDHWFMLIFLLLLAQPLYARYSQGLNAYPGPFLASVSGVWRVWYTWCHRHEKPLVKLHEEYGEVVRIAPNVLSFSDPRAIKDIYGAQQNFPKSRLNEVTQSTSKGVPQPTIFSTTDQAWHAKIRKVANPAFTMAAISPYEPSVESTISVFMEALERRLGSRIDLTEWIYYLTWDVMGEITYGERQGFVDAGDDVWEIFPALRRKMDYGIYVGQIPWLDKFLMKNPLLLWLDKRGCINTADQPVQFALKHQAAHRAKRKGGLSDPTESKGLLDKFLDIQEAHPDEVTDREMMGLGLTMIFAGAETTAITLTGIFYYILKDKLVLDKLVKEIDTLPIPTTFSAAQKLPYLDACVKEACRLLPVSGALFERVVPSPGSMICGHFIPAGTIVGASAWVLHRNISVFGEDVEDFRPERWLGEESKVKEMNRVLVNFGSGVHVCLGKNIALMEMYKIIPEILRRFEIKLEDPSMVLKTTISTFMYPSEVYVEMRRR